MRVGFLKNLTNVIASNATILVLGVIVTFVLPKLSNTVADYGYWQLYFFYTGYFGLFAFGLSDGLNLLHAGKQAHELKKSEISSHLGALLLITFIASIVIIILSFIFAPNPSVATVYISIAIGIFLLNISGYCLQIHQITLQFKQYSKLLSLERIIFVIALIPLLFLGKHQFYLFIIISLTTRAVTSLYGLYTIRNILIPRFLLPRHVFKARRLIARSMVTGLPVTLNVILMMLIVSVPRVVVEHTLSIQDYGIFSFAFATLAIVSWIFPAFSSYLYPSLRRATVSRYPVYARTMKRSVNYISGIALVISFGVPQLINLLFPQYTGANDYLFLLFPWLIYQAISGVVNDTFFRLMRKERQLLTINIITIFIIFIVSFGAMLTTNSLRVTLLAGLVVVLMWANIGYTLLMLNNKWHLDITDFLDVIFVIAFVILCYCFSSQVALISYSIFVMSLLSIFRGDLLQTLRNISLRASRDNHGM